jgi:hypothetical protein
MILATMAKDADDPQEYHIQKLVSEPGKVEWWDSEGLGASHGYETCAAASKAIRSLQPLANRDPAWAGLYRVRCGRDTACTIILTTRGKVPTVEKRTTKSGRRYGDARRTAEHEKRISALEDEREEIKEMISKLEDFVFMEETATKVAGEIKRLASKYPASKSLAAAASVAARGFERFHHGVIDMLSRALDELDDADEARISELDDLEQS